MPANARALAVNVTVTAPTAPGVVTFTPAGIVPMGASTISYGPGQTRANNAVAALGEGGAVLVHCAQASGTVHLVVDVSGWFR